MRAARDEVEPMIRKVVANDVKILEEATLHHLDSGGKRLRPAMCLAAADALGVDRKKVLAIAAACELLHNAYLIHDDIEDGDTVRRDRPAVWAKYGLAHGINTGDYLVGKVLELVLAAEDAGLEPEKILRILKWLAKTNLHTISGQALDIGFGKETAPDIDAYLRMTMQKTGHYLTLPLICAAVTGDFSDKQIEKIVEFGQYVGAAFQIQDDIIDLTGGKGRGGRLGNDIREGKRTILVCRAFQLCDESEKKKMLEILDKPRKETTEHDIAWMLALLDKYDALGFAHASQRDLLSRALISTKEVPQLGPLLEEFANFAISRAN